MPETRRKAGRPHTIVNEKLLEDLQNLCALQCTDAEIAAFFKVDISTVERWKKRPKLANVFERGRHMGKVSLRRLQFHSANAGSVPMQIHLGKVYLGQMDKAEKSATDLMNVISEILDESYGPPDQDSSS